MILWLFILLSALTYADPSWKWSNAVKIVEKHEFYHDNEIIKKPQGSWQTLFGVLYHDANLKTFKDCVFYRVPQEAQAGMLKIKTVEAKEKCETFLFAPGDQQWDGLKALQYTIKKNFLNLSMTDAKFQIIRWDVPLFNVFEHPTPKSLMSSAEYRAPKMIFLNPNQGKDLLKPQLSALKPEKKLCHDVSEDCKEVSPSTCSLCPNGWYEIPNGCPEGPKYCGSIICGLKNQPACRRGMRYQRVDKEFKCRDDNSFAYCARGLSIQCNGSLPYCI